MVITRLEVVELFAAQRWSLLHAIVGHNYGSLKQIEPAAKSSFPQQSLTQQKLMSLTMRQGRDARRRREDTRGIQAPSTSDQHPPASSVDENMQVQQQFRETPACRRREDTWDAAPPAISYNGPSTNAQGGST